MGEDIQSRLLSWEEFNKKEFSIPYVFSVKDDAQELIYFGARHTYDSADSQYDEIQRMWRELCKRRNSANVTAVVESRLSMIQSNIEEAIHEDGEVGLIYFLGQQQSISVLCFEPSRSQTIASLLTMYTLKEIFYHKIAQMVVQWSRMNDKPQFDTWIQRYIDRDKKAVNNNDFDFSFSHVKEIHKNLFGTDFDENDEIFFERITSPSEKTTIINKISCDIDVIRDTAIVNGIVDEWQKGKSVFVVYGSSHAVVQEPALKALLK